jgi:alpha-tubulin suppressor-like RCC1 family protein
VRCWGNNSDGQLGDGSFTSSSSPVVPFNLASLAPDITGITAGGSHTCALRSDGRAFCWGDNFSGQLGTGTSGNTGPTPRSVASLTGITALAAGDAHTCALRSGGAVSCWGDNYNGQLGNGTFTNSSSAVTVTGMTNANAIVAGSAFTCVNRTTGIPACWGENLYGQLGNGAVLPPPPGPNDPPPPPLRENLPQSVVGLSGVTAIGRGSDHACAVTGTGTLAGVSCWGRNDTNQISSGTEEASSTPQPTSVLGANQVSGGDSHTCIMKPNGSAQCWGGNSSGQLGTNNTNSSSFPVSVVAL